MQYNGGISIPAAVPAAIFMFLHPVSLAVLSGCAGSSGGR